MRDHRKEERIETEKTNRTPRNDQLFGEIAANKRDIRECDVMLPIGYCIYRSRKR